MKGYKIEFSAPNEMRLVDEDFSKILNDDIVIKTEYSVISAGTEIAILSGNESWAPLPYCPGYGAVGRAINTAGDFKEGDRIFTYSKHMNYSNLNRIAVKVPDKLDAKLVPLARMAAIAITSRRVSTAGLGDWVAVYGLGLVGNLAAQFLNLSGCKVIGIDTNEKRVELAKKCGIEYAMTSKNNMKEFVNELTNGEMCASVIDASGIPQVAIEAAEIAGAQGEVILLGSPRGDYQCKACDILNNIHLWGNGCVSYKGAHEWRYPLKASKEGFYKHSIERNIEIIFELMLNGKLKINELISHVVRPDQCTEVYAGLKENPSDYTGVIFDWTTSTL